MKKSSNLPKNWASFLAVALALVITFILYQHLGRDYLFDWDEGIYAQLGVEMLESGNLLVPTWNSEPWFEKPPGVAWLTAGSIALFGQTTFGARFFMPLFAFITLIGTYFISRKIDRPITGIISLCLLASFYLFLSRARGVNTDGALLAAITSATALTLYHAPPLQVAIAIALGVMVKGPAGFLALLITFPALLSNGKKYLATTIILSLAIVAPWHIYAFTQYGDTFLTPYLKEQLLRRVSTPIEFHIENRYFYLSYLYENLKAGVLFTATLGAILLLKDFFSIHKGNKRLDLLTPIWWTLLVIAIFTVAKTRLFWYILPVYPAIAILVAFAIAYFLRGNSRRIQLISTILVCGLILQSTTQVIHSIEPDKGRSAPSNRLLVIEFFRDYQDAQLVYVFVPKIERVFMEIMPESQRISSTFRYGGMPNILFYLNKPVYFIYTREELRSIWNTSEEDPYAIFANSGLDVSEMPEFSDILYSNEEFLAIRRGEAYVTDHDRALKTIQQ